MTGNSFLQGTRWYWRQGVRQTPMHSYREGDDVYKTKELYTPVWDEDHMSNLMSELSKNGIEIACKRTHSSYDIVPRGSLIVYAALSQEKPIQKEEENIKKLKNYIVANGGEICETKKEPSIIKGLFLSLFGGGRK